MKYQTWRPLKTALTARASCQLSEHHRITSRRASVTRARVRTDTARKK